MREIWSQHGRVALERDFWIAVMKGQRDLGVPIPADAIKDYERVKGEINLASIDKRERATLHDVKARIEEFSELAKRQFIHLGLTSRDLTENVEQLQILRALKIVQFKAAAALLALGRQAEVHRDLMITGRTHNVPAQPTTLGKRVAMFGQELLVAFERLDELIARYPVRGLKGAVGTQLDQLTLLGGDAHKVADLEARVLRHLGFRASLATVGQVYPRSLDFEVVTALHQLGAAAASFAVTLRLMAGAGLVTEGFLDGQVGSSAMPHKVNARNCERICGFSTILSGYVAMTGALAGHQWNEGDVSCSVVRRVALPDAFFAIDGLLETFLTVLRHMEVCPAAVHDHDPDGSREERRRPRNRARGDQGTRPGRGQGAPRGRGRGRPARPICRRPAHRAGKKGPARHPGRKFAIRRRRAASGGRLCRRGEAAGQTVPGKRRLRSRPAVVEIFICHAWRRAV
jgi:adenylosuccinate lyase